MLARRRQSAPPKMPPRKRSLPPLLLLPQKYTHSPQTHSQPPTCASQTGSENSTKPKPPAGSGSWERQTSFTRAGQGSSLARPRPAPSAGMGAAPRSPEAKGGRPPSPMAGGGGFQHRPSREIHSAPAPQTSARAPARKSRDLRGSRADPRPAPLLLYAPAKGAQEIGVGAGRRRGAPRLQSRRRSAAEPGVARCPALRARLTLKAGGSSTSLVGTQSRTSPATATRHSAPSAATTAFLGLMLPPCSYSAPEPEPKAKPGAPKRRLLRGPGKG